MLAGGAVFSESRAARAVRFFESLRHTKGRFHGEPFTLLPWEKTIVRDVYGTVTMDTVSLEMQARGLHPEMLGNAAGSVFRGKDWRFTGRWEKSARVSNHARVNRVWELA